MTALAPELVRHAPVNQRGIRPAQLDSSVPSSDGFELAFIERAGGIAATTSGAFYVSDLAHGAIWRCGRDGSAVPVLGRWRGAPDRPRSAAGLALAPDKALVVADPSGQRIWRVALDGACRVLAGDCYGHRDGAAGDALFRFPSGVAVAPDGTCYVADTGNDKVRTISPDGHVATLAGSIFTFADGQGTAAGFRRPSALALDGAGTCAVADTENNAIRLVAPDGTVTTLAGSPPGGSADGVGTGADLQGPSAIAAGHDARWWVADYANGSLRVIGTDGRVRTGLRLPERTWPVAVAVPGDGSVVALAASRATSRPTTVVRILDVSRMLLH
ncbi:MAG: hypothetical protein M0004_13235 [Actinomycetota bacterium]|nr:hypothetical protein [Actinomycetota bacterium]